MFAHRYRYFFILLLAVYSFVNTVFVEALVYYQIDLPNEFVLFVFIAVVGLVWEGNRFISRWIPTWTKWLKGRIHLLIITFAASLIMTTALIFPLAWVLTKYYLVYSAEAMRLPLKITMAFAFRINLFLNTINAIFQLVQQVRFTQVEAERFKKISAQAQFQSLKNQVNPHFLFNNLNVLASLVNKDAKASTEFIEQLAKVYRYVLNQYDNELVDLRSEMEFIQAYVYLLETRFGSALRVEIDVPEPFLEYYLVPVALQMLFENAIKHNVSSKNHPLMIRVTVDSSPALTVTNNWQPKAEQEPSTGIGLGNILRRYEFVTSRQVVVTQDEKYFSVSLPLIHLSTNEHSDNRG